MIKIETVAGIILTILGLTCLFFPLLDAKTFFYTVAVICTLSALGLWFVAFKRRRGLNFLAALGGSLIAILFWTHTMYSQSLILILFSLYMIANGINELIQFFLDFHDQAANNWHHVIYALLYIALGAGALIYGRSDVSWVMRYFGLYLLLQALQLFMCLFFSYGPKSSRAYAFSSWVALPTFIVSLLPGITLHLMLKGKYKDKPLEWDVHKNDEPVNLRVFIHSGLTGEKMMGHMTFSYKGVMYSYGNYDLADEKFFRSYGPGIFFTVPADIYVNNSCVVEKSILFEYGLHLDEAQEAKLVSLIDEVFDETTRWLSPIEEAKDGWQDFKKYEKDYSCRLSYYTGAKFRKFLKGQWKTYWILGDNCSLFAEDILSKLGCNIVHKNGIVSPGEYFEFFEEAFQDPKSNVVYKSWHDASLPSTLFETLI